MDLFLGLLAFGVDAWGIASVLGSPARGSAKAGWVLLIVALPLLGFALWLMWGPRPRKVVTR